MTQKRLISIWKGQPYETPSVNILDVQVEGVLCESGIGINDLVENGDELLDFD